MEAHLPNSTEKFDQFTDQLKQATTAMQNASQLHQQFINSSPTPKKLNHKQ